MRREREKRGEREGCKERGGRRVSGQGAAAACLCSASLNWRDASPRCWTADAASRAGGAASRLALDPPLPLARHAGADRRALKPFVGTGDSRSMCVHSAEPLVVQLCLALAAGGSQEELNGAGHAAGGAALPVHSASVWPPRRPRCAPCCWHPNVSPTTRPLATSCLSRPQSIRHVSASANEAGRPTSKQPLLACSVARRRVRPLDVAPRSRVALAPLQCSIRRGRGCGCPLRTSRSPPHTASQSQSRQASYTPRS